MKIVGLTGGIGSGKTTIGKIFARHGIPVYVADDEGRKISDMPEVKAQIAAVFGSAVLDADGHLNRKALSDLVFSDASALAQLNNIVHPAVKSNFKKWQMQFPDAPFVIRESAILFESGSASDCDHVITVNVPEEIRIERVMERDGVSKKAVLERLQNQWTDAQRTAQSDFTIENMDLAKAEEEAVKILKNLSNP